MNYFKIENGQVILIQVNEENVTTSDEVYNFLKSNNLIEYDYDDIEFEYNYDLVKEQNCIDLLYKNEFDEWEDFLTIYIQEIE